MYVRPSARAPDLLEKLCVSVFSYTGPRASPQRGRSTVRRLGVVCCVPHGSWLRVVCLDDDTVIRAQRCICNFSQYFFTLRSRFEGELQSGGRPDCEHVISLNPNKRAKGIMV